MTECLNNFLLNRNQYIETRDFARSNYELSSWSVPFVSDDIVYGIPNFRGVYSKGFPGHTGGGASGPIGPEPVLYQTFLNGIKNKDLNVINTYAISAPRLVDPYCLFDVEYEGIYRASYNLPLAPSMLSPQGQAEMLEVYSMSILRDFHTVLLDPSDSRYSDLSDSSWTQAKTRVLDQCAKLTGSGFVIPVNYIGAPTQSGIITPSVLYRGNTKGDLIGPYMSQFFYYAAFPGNQYINQNYLVPDLSWNVIDFSKNALNIKKSNFVSLWNGGPGQTGGNFALRYISTMHDVSIYINKDEVWQAFFTTASILIDRGVRNGFYMKKRGTGGRFVNLGTVDLFTLMLKAMKQAMNACWVWKWQQMKIRPEEMAYQTNLHKNFGYTLDFSGSYINSSILDDISNNNFGNYYLPLAYSSGCPGHPAYPAGHATFACALGTIVKAWFNCESTIEGYVPVVTTAPYNITSGTSLEVYKYAGSGATGVFLINDEIDKMVSNCGYSRAMAGVHYRSDCDAGFTIGENAAISTLQQEVYKYDDIINFRFRKRDGTIINIANAPQGAGPTEYPLPTPSTKVYYSAPTAIAPSLLPRLTTTYSVVVTEPGFNPDPTSNSIQNFGSGPGF
jgi:hypothetical protein